MASKNEVTLTFAGDNDQLSRVFANTGAAADKMQADVSAASDRMASDTAQATDRMAKEVRDSAESFDRASEATDALDTRAMGFRDTVTGVQDSVIGFSQVLKGDFSADALFVAGAGVGDLASGFTNLLIPGLKSARDWTVRATAATRTYITTARGATVALGAIGIALTAATAAFLIFRQQQDEVEVSTENLVQDLERFQNSGRITGEITKILGDDASELKGRLEALDPALRDNRGLWDSFLDTFRANHTEMDLLKKELADLDEGLAAFVREGGDGKAVLDDLAAAYGLSEQEMQHVIQALPRYRQEMERAKEEEIDATDAVFDHLASLKELGDELRAQTDPVFAWIQAQQRVEDQQKAVTEAAKEFGRNSPEHERALLDLAAAELGLVDATSDVQGAFDESLIPALEQLVEDGHLSESAFRELRDELQRSKRAADELDQTRIRINTHYSVTASGGQPGSFYTLPGGGRIPFHIGGIVPGPIGTEVPAILQAGEKVVPRGGDGAHHGGLRADDLRMPAAGGLDRLFLAWLQDTMRKNNLQLVRA